MNEAKPVAVPITNPQQAIQVLDHSPTPLDLIQRAVQSNAQVDVMEKLLGLQERWERNEARKAFDNAISKAKSEIPVIRKGNVVDFTSSRGRTSYSYEDLATIAATIDPILSKYGLSYRFRTNSDSKSVTITCVLSHSAGHCEENSLYAPHDASGNKNAIQAVGSAVTYLQRYTLKAALGLAAAADDDARGVNPPVEHKAKAQTPSPKTQPPPAVKSEMPPGQTLLPVCQISLVTPKSGTDAKGKPWNAWFVKFSDGVAEVEAVTFSHTVGEIAEQLSQTGETARVVIEPGKKPGRMNIVSIERADTPPATEEDNVPMSYPSDEPAGVTP